MHLILDKNRPLVDKLVEEAGLPLKTAERAVLDWQKGNNERLRNALLDQVNIGIANQRAQHRSVDGLGQCTRRLSPSLELELQRIYGRDALKDDKWLNKLAREEGFGMQPQYDRKARITRDF